MGHIILLIFQIITESSQSSLPETFREAALKNSNQAFQVILSSF